jgi:hypothetical protein
MYDNISFTSMFSQSGIKLIDQTCNELLLFNMVIIYLCTVCLNLRKKLVKCYIWSIALYGAETLTLRKLDQKYLETFEIWC